MGVPIREDRKNVLSVAMATKSVKKHAFCAYVKSKQSGTYVFGPLH